jgi:hypothetical protein
VVLASTLFLAVSGMAIRGVVVERGYQREIEAIRAPHRIASRHAIRARRAGVSGKLETVPIPAVGAGHLLLSFTLLEPSAGADSFQLALISPLGENTWTDVVAAEGLTTSVAVVLDPRAVSPGDYRLTVGERRSSDEAVLESYEIPFRLVLVDTQ